MRRNALLGLLALILPLLAATPGRVAAAEACGATPRAVVETFHADLLATMRAADSLTPRQRFDRLAPTVRACFNLDLMTRVAVGRHWRKADSGQRQTLVAAFSRMSIATYADQFDGFAGERFETLGTRPGPQGTTLVETRINRPDAEPVGFTYVVRKNGDAWRVVDILLDDDVSQLATRRSEYRRVLADEGVPGLVRLLREKAESLLEG